MYRRKALDIIHLKMKNGLAKGGLNWYEWALSQGLIETIYEDGVLQGFAEWVRLKEIPTDVNHADLDHDIVKVAPVLLIVNVMSSCPRIIWQLRKKVLDKNKDYEVVCWHRKKDDRIISIKNWRLVNAV